MMYDDDEVYASVVVIDGYDAGYIAGEMMMRHDSLEGRDEHGLQQYARGGIVTFHRQALHAKLMPKMRIIILWFLCSYG